MHSQKTGGFEFLDQGWPTSQRPRATFSGGLRVVGTRGKAENGGPLMASLYSANCDKTF